jgi:NAD(P)H-flavin reductase
VVAGEERHDRLPRPLRQQLPDGQVGRQKPDLHRRRNRHASASLCDLVCTWRTATSLGTITIVYGARRVQDLVFRQELDRWAEYDRVRVVRCVDPGGETPDWTGEVGFVPAVTERAQIPAENAVALVIGPPVMIKFTLPVLAKMGLADRDIYTSLENRMKCGVGQVWPLQLRARLCLQRRSRVHTRTAQIPAE